MARALVGAQAAPRVELSQVARFDNRPIITDTGLQWNFPALFGHIHDGLVEVFRRGPVASIGVDSWAVDYALVSGGATSLPFHYRDERSATGVERVHEIVPFTQLYARNGLQFLPFNTLYQLASEAPRRLEGTDGVLLIPDLVNYLLTGVSRTERTNASTTGLLDVATGDWDTALMHALGFPERLFSPLVTAGDAVGSHDTASAVVAVPMDAESAAYISCGTSGLVGVETGSPITSEAARAANFTNEGGVDGRNRFLHNVMGLWLLSESMAQWAKDGSPAELAPLLPAAAAIPAGVARGWVFDANDPRFLAPGDMPARIRAWLAEHGRPGPVAPAEVARSIIESLAAAFADAVHTAAELSCTPVRTIHVVGGGSLNELLCQRTADWAGLPVLAGPVEATAIGNVLVQARSHGWVGASLEDLRAVVAASFSPRRYDPRR